jgi:hypothetical protein
MQKRKDDWRAVLAVCLDAGMEGSLDRARGRPVDPMRVDRLTAGRVPGRLTSLCERTRVIGSCANSVNHLTHPQGPRFAGNLIGVAKKCDISTVISISGYGDQAGRQSF